MITEKQKEAVMELCRYVENFCKENDLSAFMSVAAVSYTHLPLKS